MKFVTENHSTLHAKSGSKLHHITHIQHDESYDAAKLLHSKGQIAIGNVPGIPSLELITNANCGDREIQLSEHTCPNVPNTDLFLRTMGKYFQVAFVTTSIEAGEKLVEPFDYEIIGYLDCTERKLMEQGLKLYFWAFGKPAKISTK